jgi:hypothetical protein
MFTGHYSVGFAAKPAAPFVPLWVYFVAAQWLDSLGGVRAARHQEAPHRAGHHRSQPPTISIQSL